MKAADTYTIEKVGIPSLVFMERAALETVRVLRSDSGASRRVSTGTGGMWKRK